MLPLLNSGYVSSLLQYVTFCGKFSIESIYGAFSVPNFVFEKALIFICMCALVILSLETQWHFGVDAWVGHMRIILILDLLLFS